VWWDYLAGLPALERYFGVGTPDHMPTVRGFLTRLVGVGRHLALVDALTVAAWLVAIAAAGAAAVRTRASDGRAAFAAALAFGALASPHLFPQDVLLWIAPLTLVLAGARGGAGWTVRSRVALVWPLWFVLARALDIRSTPEPRLPVDLMLVPLVLCAVWAAREAWRPLKATA
jgi:hypothetical protein